MFSNFFYYYSKLFRMLLSSILDGQGDCFEFWGRTVTNTLRIIFLMKKIFINTLFLIILAVTTATSSSNPAWAQEKEITNKPFTKCWELSVEGIDKSQLASDKVNKIFYSHGGGFISSVEVTNGEILWNTQLGGTTLDAIFDEGLLYVVSANDIEGKEHNKNVFLRAVGAESGIVKWQTSLGTIDLATEEYNSKILVDRVNLFLVSGKGEIFTVSKSEGFLVDKSSIGAERLSSLPTISSENIFFGTASRNLYVYSISAKQFRKFPLEEFPTALALIGEKIIVGTKTGAVSAFDFSSGRKVWGTRFGAGISNIANIADELAVSSNDNFVYLISAKNGGKSWKKRLTGRNTAVNYPATESVLAVDLNGTNAVFIDSGRGTPKNQISIEPPDFFVNKPLVVKDYIVFHTNEGLVAYSSGFCPQNNITKK